MRGTRHVSSVGQTARRHSTAENGPKSSLGVCLPPERSIEAIRRSFSNQCLSRSLGQSVARPVRVVSTACVLSKIKFSEQIFLFIDFD